MLVLLCLIAGGYLYPWMERRRKEMLGRKEYESVEVGSLYIQEIRREDPFECGWGKVVEIIDKKMNARGITYVKYKEVLDHDRVWTCPYEEFVGFYSYVPYNNQNKES